MINSILNAGCNMNYYKEHSQEFIADTLHCDMSEQYCFFEKYLHSKGTILDIGFGSGRDSLYFKSKGYDVYSIDPEEEFVKHAKNLGLFNVFCMKAQEMEFDNMFDGIWACASLLHINSSELNDTFKKCYQALKNNGVMYASFKYGCFDGERNGRHYKDLTKKSLLKYIKGSKLKIIDTFISEDVRPERKEKWLNVLLIKELNDEK